MQAPVALHARELPLEVGWGRGAAAAARQLPDFPKVCSTLGEHFDRSSLQRKLARLRLRGSSLHSGNQPTLALLGQCALRHLQSTTRIGYAPDTTAILIAAAVCVVAHRVLHGLHSWNIRLICH